MDADERGSFYGRALQNMAQVQDIILENLCPLIGG